MTRYPPSGPEEAKFLKAYRRRYERYPKPSVTADVVAFTIRDSLLQVLLIRRKDHPGKGRWAIPGGFVEVGDAFEDQGEDLEVAAARELAEETGLPMGASYMEQLYTFGKSGRDPRTRIITVAYIALIRPDLAAAVRAGDDAEAARWFPVEEALTMSLAFDHNQILHTAVTRLRGKIDYSNIAFELVPRTFTVVELRAVHEVIKGESYDPGNFRRRFHRMMTDGIIEKAPGRRPTSTRPAELYRFRQRSPGRRKGDE